MAVCTFVIWACCGVTTFDRNSRAATVRERLHYQKDGGMMRLIALLTFASALAAFAKDANEDLLSASRAGDLAAVKTAIESGAALETKTPYGQTPLYLAAMNGHEAVVRFLLDKGASADVSDI